MADGQGVLAAGAVRFLAGLQRRQCHQQIAFVTGAQTPPRMTSRRHVRRARWMSGL